MRNIYKGSMLFMLLISCTLILVGCNKETTSNENTPPKTNDTKTADKPAENKPSENTTASTSGDKIGVAECDEYLDKYEACVSSKVPEAAKAQLKSSLETARKSYKEIAATPEGRNGLAMTCKQALTTTKQAMAAYGCTW